MRLDLSRALNIAAAVLIGVLAAMLLGPRLQTRAAAPAEPPSLEELHRAALARAAAPPPEGVSPERAGRLRVEAWDRARAAIRDDEARALYERGIALLEARRAEEADTAFAVALRLERERDVEW